MPKFRPSNGDPKQAYGHGSMNMFDAQMQGTSSEHTIGKLEGTSEFPTGSFLLPVRNESLDLREEDGREAHGRRSSRELRAKFD